MRRTSSKRSVTFADISAPAFWLTDEVIDDINKKIEARHKEEN